MKKLCLIALNIFLTFAITAQENTANQWFFGEHCGVDFSHGVPYGVTGGQIMGWEGCATVGDMDGNLLFYTDGQVIYDKNHNIMQNGTGLMGHWSSAQSSIIVRLPGNNHKYYVFTTDDTAEQHLQNGWRYSVVDMSLNGGLGAVTEVKNVLLEADLVTEKQVAIMHSNNVNIWIIAHKWNSNEFLAYEITTEGISTTPVISAIGSIHEGGYSPNPVYNGWTNGCGIMKTTKDGDKIALSIHIMGIFELFDFNKTTGEISNCRTSPYYTTAYGVEFSPDGNKLYTTVDIYNVSKLYQFNLEQPNPFSNPTIIAVEENTQNRGIQLAPNGKIYATKYLGDHLAVINYPDEAGSACGYVSNDIYLNENQCHAGLPSLFFYKGFNFFTGSEVEIEICQGDSIFLQNAYQTAAGTYYDTVQSYLGWDSIVNTHLIILPALSQPAIYEEDGILHSSFADNYQWHRNSSPIAGATAQVYQPFINGNYSVEVWEDDFCHVFSNDFPFIYQNLNQNDLNSETIFPNPFQEVLNVYFKEKHSVKIYDYLGILMFEENDLIGYSELSPKNLSSGIYLIKIISKDKTIVKKIIKE